MLLSFGFWKNGSNSSRLGSLPKPSCDTQVLAEKWEGLVGSTRVSV